MSPKSHPALLSTTHSTFDGWNLCQSSKGRPTDSCLTREDASSESVLVSERIFFVVIASKSLSSLYTSVHSSSINSCAHDREWALSLAAKFAPLLILCRSGCPETRACKYHHLLLIVGTLEGTFFSLLVMDDWGDWGDDVSACRCGVLGHENLSLEYRNTFSPSPIFRHSWNNEILLSVLARLVR